MQLFQIRCFLRNRFKPFVKYLAVIGIIGANRNIGYQVQFIVRIGCLGDIDALALVMTITFFAVSGIYVIGRLKCTAVEFFGRLYCYLVIDDCKMLRVNTLKYAEYLDVLVAVL